MDYEIIFPEYYKDDEFVQFETENKGYLFGVKLKSKSNIYELVFYDIGRLKQEAEDENKEYDYFHEPNLIILNKITKESIEKAISNMFDKNEMEYLLSD